jgi:hypothetical protein
MYISCQDRAYYNQITLRGDYILPFENLSTEMTNRKFVEENV